MSRILVVEDNANLAYGLTSSLEMEGHQVAVAADGEEGLRALRDSRPDLIILDLMLPGIDGYRMLKIMRQEGRRVPVLVLTARTAENDKLLAFGLGVDDYVTKPFGLLELLARVKALLRRAQPAESRSESVTIGDLEVSASRRCVRRAGREIALTPKELDLLLALVRRDGRVATRLELLAEVWGHRAAVMTRTVDMHIAQLRRKLETDPSEPRFILTVWKAGYRLAR